MVGRSEARCMPSEIVDRWCKHEDLPDSSIWHPLREDKERNERRVNKLMEEALSHLRVANLSERRREYTMLAARISKNRSAVGRHMEEMIAAPEDVGTIPDLWTKSRDEHETEIKKLKVDIEKCETRQEEITKEMREEMVRMGLNVSQSQLESILLAVSGDSFCDLVSCFHNVKELTNVVAKLVVENKDYVQNARKYYGMYASLIGMLAYAHERAQGDIRSKYIPEIEDIIEKTEKTKERTQRLIKRNSSDRENIGYLRKNIEVQDIVLRAGHLYVAHLHKQNDKLERAKAELERQRIVALNTYETAQLASAMLGTISKSVEALTAIQNMQLPEMLPLDSEQIRREFESITEQLRHIR